MTSEPDRARFLDEVRAHLFDGKLNASQIAGLTAILDYWGQQFPDADDRWLAYVLATTHHETDRTIQPLREYGRGKGRPYGVPDPVTGLVYYGRGFVQLTWKRNYEIMSDVVGVDLVTQPDLALDLAIATKILCQGMTRGLFTGKALCQYFHEDVADWVHARRIINGLDQAAKIASYGQQYQIALRQANL